MLQGIVDCFFEEIDGIVIVDFKTDHVTSAEIKARAEEYRPQLETYGQALSRILGRPIKEKISYFLLLVRKFLIDHYEYKQLII